MAKKQWTICQCFFGNNSKCYGPFDKEDVKKILKFNTKFAYFIYAIKWDPENGDRYLVYLKDLEPNATKEFKEYSKIAFFARFFTCEKRTERK